MRTSVAVCDQEAFDPLRNLVEGPLTDLAKLKDVERFVRTVVLHDEMKMEPALLPYVPDSELECTEDERHARSSSVIVAIGPALTGYPFFTGELGFGELETPPIMLSPSLLEAARNHSNAEEGNVYYEAHVEYLQRVINVVSNGGSVLLGGEFAKKAISAAAEYPERLFQDLDRDWQQIARHADSGQLGFMVPPVLSIILTRTARRDAIPNTIEDLRYEWREPRAKVWALLHRLKTVRTVDEWVEIRKELAAASRGMCVTRNRTGTRPTRVLWDLVVGSAAGAAVAMVSGGSPGVGAAIGAIGAGSRSFLPLISDVGPTLFGRGAFDLARRVKRETQRAELGSLARLLTDAEKTRLGL